MTDLELIQRFLRRADGDAFRALYARHSPAVYGLLRRLAGSSRDLADDVLQDAWMRAARMLGTFRHESTFRTWLTGIAINCYRERRRAEMRRRESSDLPEQMTAAPARALDVTNVLDGLEPPHREAIVLHDIEGWTHEEIASALGIEIGTSKSRLSRARQIFRERWAGGDAREVNHG